MVVLDPRKDAEAVFDVLDKGGVAIVPLDVAYAVFGGCGEAIKNIFTAKGRSFSKPNGMMADFEIFSELHIVGARERTLVRAVTEDYGLPLSVVAPFRADHPIFASVDEFTMERSTKIGTLDLLLNAGPLHKAITELSRQRMRPVLGSSANRSLTGSKYRLQDVDREVRDIAAIEIDYGLSRYANPEGISSTIIDLKSFQVHRYGVCFEQISDILNRHFQIQLPARPAPVAA
ncbi:Sua5/YciO/YrdC/YwlC family protein [Xanthobacter sp. KR7-225]|uniref:Sua5/YciO/YrdC/YwlC family protein n=1 Tax=Xanthobacter sp. KR7-225 TaxID=3156613 RepID=UPI0032B56A26